MSMLRRQLLPKPAASGLLACLRLLGCPERMHPVAHSRSSVWTPALAPLPLPGVRANQSLRNSGHAATPAAYSSPVSRTLGMHGSRLLQPRGVLALARIC